MHEFWTTFVDSLDEEAPEGTDVRIPHRGMSKKVQDALTKRGYLPVDVRFIDEPEQAILQTIRGATRFGTIQLSQPEITALRTAASIHGLLDKDRKRDSGEVTFKDTEDLLKDLTQTKAPDALDLVARRRGKQTKQHEARIAALPDEELPAINLEDAINEILQFDGDE